MRLDLGKFVLHVVRVHGPNLISGRSAEHFDNLNKLIDARLAWEEGLAQHQFRHDTASRPDIYNG